jgi:hypothetical protein
VDCVIGDSSLLSVWKRPVPIMNALLPFLSQPNIAFWSPDGYRNLTSVRLGSEAGCLELRSSVEAPSIVRPHGLTLRRITEGLAESFLVLELAKLYPWGGYARSPGDRRLVYSYEEICELPDGSYADRDLYGDVDDDRRANARVVTRWFGGQIVIVSPSSLLNLNHRNDDGRLSSKTVAEIRAIIELALRRPSEGDAPTQGDA